MTNYGQITEIFLCFCNIATVLHSIVFAGDLNTVVEPFPFETENGTEPFGTGECNLLLNTLY